MTEELCTQDEPVEPKPEDCCGEGCASCVWDVYRKKLMRWQASQHCSSINADETIALSKLEFTPCILLSITNHTCDTSAYKFAIPNYTGPGSILQPGQHLELESFYSNEKIVRKYSPINWQRNEFEVIIKRYKSGKMSQFLETIKTGSTLHWRGPYGNINYITNKQKLLLLLCAGTGVAPMLPIIRSIVEDSDDETVVKMLCGSHTLESRLLLKELKELSSYWNFSFVHYVPSLDGTPSWGEEVIRCRISEVHVAEAIRPTEVNKCKMYICGPDAFNTDMKNIANKLGIRYFLF